METFLRIACLKAKFIHVRPNSGLCVQCGMWIPGRYGVVRRVASKFSCNFAHRKCEGNIGEAVE